MVKRARYIRRKVRRPVGMSASGRFNYVTRRPRFQRTKKGFLSVFRKLPEIYVTNTTTNPNLSVQDPTGSCLTLGAPIADANGATASYPFVLTFQLDQLINYTDVTNLCDAYKLKYVSTRMTYQSTQASVLSSSIMPTITWISDEDDNNLPSSINQVREKMGSKMKTFGFNKICKIGVQPRVADTIYGGLVAAYSIARPRWINAAYAAVPHYAIKGILNNVIIPVGASATLNSFKFDITALVHGKDFQ